MDNWQWKMDNLSRRLVSAQQSEAGSAAETDGRSEFWV